MERRERHLAGPDQVERRVLVGDRRRGCAASVGRNPVPNIASSRTSTGVITGVKPCLRREVERVAHQRELQRHRAPGQVVEARARRAHAAVDVDHAERLAELDVVARREGERRAARPSASAPRCRRRSRPRAPTRGAGWAAARRSRAAPRSPRPARPRACRAPRTARRRLDVRAALVVAAWPGRRPSTAGSSRRAPPRRARAAPGAPRRAAAPGRGSRTAAGRAVRHGPAHGLGVLADGSEVEHGSVRRLRPAPARPAPPRPAARPSAARARRASPAAPPARP